MMDFLFNETVFQHFLLSQKGENLHEFKDFVFRLFDFVKLLGETNPNITQERKNYLRQILEQIRKVWHKPTLKAIINWGMNSQSIGADSILTEVDRQFINQYQSHKRMMASSLTGKNIQADSQREANFLLENGEFLTSEKALIKEGLSKEASNDERLMAVAMLDEADARYTQLDFEIKDMNIAESLIELDSILDSTAINNIDKKS